MPFELVDHPKFKEGFRLGLAFSLGMVTMLLIFMGYAFYYHVQVSFKYVP